jgi:RNA polymerase sigma factor (sigma-70 family)
MDYDRSQIQPLPDSEIRELIRKAQAGDIAARDRILLSNSGFRLRAAKRYRLRSTYCIFNTYDLAGEALLGEIEAIKRFDLSRDTAYLTYAGYWIHQAMQHAIRDGNDLIRRPQHIRTLLSKASQLEALGKTDAEIDEALEITPALKVLMEHARKCSCVHDKGDFMDDVAWGSDDDGAIDRSELIQAVREAIAGLSERSRLVIERRMRGDLLVVIGEDLGVTRERVRQIELAAERAIRNYVLRHRPSYAGG